MASCVLILSNSDSGLYDFRKEVLQALLDEGWRVVVSVPDTGYVERIRQLGCEYLPTSFERRGMNPFKMCIRDSCSILRGREKNGFFRFSVTESF